MAKKKDSVIKNLSGYIEPLVVVSEKGTIVSVGMVNGQKYYTYNKPESGLDQKPRTFDESYHVGIGNFNTYSNDIAKLINNNQIYVVYVSPQVIDKIKEPDRQISMF